MYIEARDGVVTVMCKGCRIPLHKTELVEGKVVQTIYPECGDLYIAMVEIDGRLSRHSTPMCPSCAVRPDLDLQGLWFEDVAQFMASSPKLTAIPAKWVHRSPARVLKYERTVHENTLG